MDFIEQLKKALEAITDETQRAQLIETINTLHVTDVAGLKENADKLKTEKLSTKAKLEEAMKTVDGLGGRTIADFERLEKNIADLTANPGDVEKVKQIENSFKLQIDGIKAEHTALLKSKEVTVDELTQKNQELESQINKSLCDAELSAALDEINVSPKMKVVVQGFLEKDLYIDEVDGVRKVKIKVQDTPFEVATGIGVWAKTDLAKQFISAPSNQGGGAGGSGNGNPLAGMKYNDMTLAQKNQLYKEDKPTWERLKAEASK